MLHQYCSQFLAYCQMANFSTRSIQALTSRLNELANFLKIQKIRSVKRIHYRHLIDFAADDNNTLIHVIKSRIWTLRHFYHFLTLHRIIPENIATGIPYPKIKKTIPQFLTQEEYTLLTQYFATRADSLMGRRNFIIIMLLGTLGLRTRTLTALNIKDIDITCGLMWIREKGQHQRTIVLPHNLCKIIGNYLQLLRFKKGPLLISKRNKRISPYTLQDIFRRAADQPGIDKKLHARLFRYTAATTNWSA